MTAHAGAIIQETGPPTNANLAMSRDIGWNASNAMADEVGLGGDIYEMNEEGSDRSINRSTECSVSGLLTRRTWTVSRLRWRAGRERHKDRSRGSRRIETPVGIRGCGKCNQRIEERYGYGESSEWGVGVKVE